LYQLGPHFYIFLNLLIFLVRIEKNVVINEFKTIIDKQSLRDKLVAEITYSVMTLIKNLLNNNNSATQKVQ